ARVSTEIKSRDLSEALDMLEMAGIIYKVYHSSANGVPLRAESDLKKFKVLFFDIGLAQRLLKLDHRSLLLNPDISAINKGALAELLTGLELMVYIDFRDKAELHYWHREAKSSNAEVDYICDFYGRVVPIEVKSGTDGRMKSLNFFMKKKKSTVGIKLSSFNFSLMDNLHTVPLYAIEVLVKRNFFHPSFT
ncbi:MAG: DUF4143 domain-containing protein, partial [bacterium]|nr:DUF4143 domain-containing protein [bacterium]